MHPIHRRSNLVFVLQCPGVCWLVDQTRLQHVASSIATHGEGDRVLLCLKARGTGFFLYNISFGGHFLPVEPGFAHGEDLLRMVAFFLDDLLPLLEVLRSFFCVCQCLLPVEDDTRQPKPFLETEKPFLAAIKTFGWSCHLIFCRLFLLNITINSKPVVERCCLLPNQVAIKGDVLLLTFHNSYGQG